jgi:hypothetical protein
MRALTKHLSVPDHPALSMRPASPALGLLGLIAGGVLLAAAIWIGDFARMQSMSAPENPLQVVDAARALVFDAEPETGDVRVLNVRSGISEIARLHDAQRGRITTLSLDAPGHVLTVESDTGRYQYDTVSFQLLRREPLLAVAPGYPMAD